MPRSMSMSACLSSNLADAKLRRIGLIVLVVAPLRKEGITDMFVLSVAFWKGRRPYVRIFVFLKTEEVECDTEE